MKKLHIKIKNPQDMQEFINRADSISAGVNVYKGHFVIEGGSILGMMTLINEPFIVEYPSSAEDFEQFINQFAI